MTGEPIQASSSSAVQPTGGAWFLTLVFFVSAFNLGDRQIIGVLAERIKHEFGLTDTLVGLLSGTAFALIYPPLGFPIAWLSDRFSRRNILAAALAFWSAMTVLCGLAGGFGRLVLARMGVAVGEAGYAPANHALIARYFPARQRARAFSVLTAGGAVGAFAASWLGALAASHMGWRSAFLMMGAPGLLLAPLLLFTVREPPRDLVRSANHNGSTLTRLLHNPTNMYCILGSALHLMVAFAMSAWTAPYLLRAFHLPLPRVGLILGASSLVGGLGGGVLGGLVGDWLARFDRRWLSWWPAPTVIAAIPFGVGAFHLNALDLVVTCIFAAGFLNALYLPSTYALVQDQVGEGERAIAAALMIFVQNLVGLGLGPLLVGGLSDGLQSRLGGQALGTALSAVFLLNLVAAIFYLKSGGRLRAPAHR